jgi:hypothetical protein
VQSVASRRTTPRAFLRTRQPLRTQGGEPHAWPDIGDHRFEGRQAFLLPTHRGRTAASTAYGRRPRSPLSSDERYDRLILPNSQCENFWRGRERLTPPGEGKISEKQSLFLQLPPANPPHGLAESTDAFSGLSAHPLALAKRLTSGQSHASGTDLSPPATPFAGRSARRRKRRARSAVYCADYRCSNSIAIGGDGWPDELRLSAPPCAPISSPAARAW